MHKLLPGDALRRTGARWRGGRQPQNLTVYGEQSAGDVVHFAPLLSLLRRDTTVRFQVPSKTADLLGRLPGCIEVTTHDAPPAPRPGEAWAPLLDLPRVLDVSPDQLRQRLDHPARRPDGRSARVRIGVFWQANPRFPNRSLPLSALKPLSDVAHFDLVSLQHQAGVEQIATCGFAGALATPIDQAESRDFRSALKILETVDAVVSVDSTIAHCALSMGLPVFILLHAFTADWRWLETIDSSIIFPNAKLFRLSRGQPWSALIRDSLAPFLVGRFAPAVGA